MVDKTKLTQMPKDCCGDLISVEFKLKLTQQLKLEPFTLVVMITVAETPERKEGA